MSLAVPAVLAYSREDLDRKIAHSARAPIDRIQIDVVDGKFASPASWPYNEHGSLEALAASGWTLPFSDNIAYEIDLMCVDAERAAAKWLAIGASRLTFHAESVVNLPRLFAAARARYGAGAFVPELVTFGIALNIGTDLALIDQCIGEISYIQLMGVSRIGRQGQPFDPRVFEKTRLCRARYPDLELQIDGGVSLENAKKFISLGVSRLVIGSAFVGANDPSACVAAFEGLESPYGV